MEIECPDCGARFQSLESVKIFTCPYCGLIFGERVEKDHYYFSLMDRDPYGVLLDFLRRQFGIPSDIASSSSLKVKELHYVPVYFYYLYGRVQGRCRGAGLTRAEESIYIGVVASRSFTDILKNYPFPVRGRRFFTNEIMSMGNYHHPEFSEVDARKYVEELFHNMLYDELRCQCRDVSDVKIEEEKIAFRGLVHYPIYYLEYEYEENRYSSYIDGVDGKIIFTEHPIKIQTRTIQIGVSVILLSVTFLVGLPISMLLASPLPLVSSMFPAIASSIPLLKRSLTRKVSSSELRFLEEESRHITYYLKKMFSMKKTYQLFYGGIG